MEIELQNSKYRIFYDWKTVNLKEIDGENYNQNFIKNLFIV